MKFPISNFQFSNKKGPAPRSRGGFAALRDSAGFTLIETMLALAVLGVALLGVLAAVQTSLNAATIVRDNLIASNLTQEGMELVRNLRDVDWRQSRSFGYFLSQAQSSLGAGPYTIDWTMNSLAAGGSNPVLKIDANGRYNYASGTDTPFHRQIYVVWSGASGEQVNVHTVVSWSYRGSNKQIEAEENLLNWR